MASSGFFKKFDSWFVDQLFSTDSSGKTYFYPWTGFGKGYLVPNAKKERDIRILYRLWIISLFFSAFTASNLSLFYLSKITLMVIVFFIWVFSYYLIMFFLTKGLKRGHKRSVGQFYQEMARKRGWTFLIVMTLLLLILFCLIFWLVLSGQAEIFWVSAIISFFLIGFLLWVLVYMLYCKFKDR